MKGDPLAWKLDLWWRRWMPRLGMVWFYAVAAIVIVWLSWVADQVF
jgi:hypothetical protein